MLNTNLSKRYVRMLLGCEQSTVPSIDSAVVMEVSSKQAYDFHVANDLRGGLKSRINIGVFNSGNLISAMSCRMQGESKVIAAHRLSFVEMKREQRQACFIKMVDYIEKKFSPCQVSITFDNLYPDFVDINKMKGFVESGASKPMMRYCRGAQRYDHTTHKQFIEMMNSYDNKMTFS